MTDTPAPRELGELTSENVTIADLPRFPGMTGWFEPRLLAKLLGRVILSDVFGQYADRRLIQAALDKETIEEQRARADLSGIMKPDHDGAIWFDFAADTGDGFDATYAIAHLLAQDELKIDDLRLPRGGALVLGGDEVYPTANRDDYTIRLRKPFSFAFPAVKGGVHPPLLALPGNHDWYDGLVVFLAIFCREKSTSIGAWRTRQRRSYFAVKLSANWWIWGIDIALVRDMDQPQADYFVSIAECMPAGANIILCSAEPGWYKAESKGESYRTLSYATWIAENAKTPDGKTKDLKIPLVLSGDSHHYARYSGAGTEYITSGGGGAFLHGTLELQPSIIAEWLRNKASLSLEACYPSKDESRKLLRGNLQFFSNNREFSLLLAWLYAFAGFALASLPYWPGGWLPRWDALLIVMAVLFAGFFGYTGYQERFDKVVGWLTAAHALVHFAIIVLVTCLALWLAARVWPLEEWHWIGRAVLMSILFVPLAPVAGTIFGLNLWITCNRFGINNNDAFSSMKLNSYRHFLRIRLHGDNATVYPIGIDRVPDRHEWRLNPGRKPDTQASIFTPLPAMQPKLIETPILVHAKHAASTTDIKTPAEMPPKN